MRRARLWLLKNTITNEGRSIRRFNELPLLKNEHPALALSWTLYHVLDEQSLLFNLDTEDLKAASVSLVVVVSGYDVVAAQTIHARNLTIIPTSDLASAMPISLKTSRTAGFESTTASSMKL